MDETKLVFIDANIFLEFLLGDKNFQNAETFLRLIHSGEIQAITTDFILYTSLLQIQWKLKSIDKMQSLLFLTSSSLGLNVVRPSLGLIGNATKYIQKYSLDFDDALVVASMVNNNVKTLYSYDRDFDKVKIIKRKEP